VERRSGGQSGRWTGGFQPGDGQRDPDIRPVTRINGRAGRAFESTIRTLLTMTVANTVARIVFFVMESPSVFAGSYCPGMARVKMIGLRLKVFQRR